MGDIKKLYNYLQSKKVQGLGSEDEFKDGFLNDSAFSQRVYDYVKPLFSDIEETRKAFVDGFREPKNNTAYATPVPYEKKKYYDPREDYSDWVDKQKQSFGNPPKDIDEAAVGIKKANNMELTPQEKSRERRAKVTEHVNANIGVERYNAYKEAEAQYRAAITSRLDADIERAKEAKRAKEEEIKKTIPQGSRALALFPQAKMAVQWTVPAYTLDILEDTKELLEAPTKGSNWAGSMWAGLRDNADMKSFLSLGMSTFAKTGKVYDICKRYTNGEALTDEETNLLEALAMNTAVAGLRAGDVSGWYRSGEITGDMVEIMGQFLLTGGIGTGATNVVSKAIGSTMKKVLPKIVSKMGAKGAVGTVLRGAKFAGKGAVDVVAGGAVQSVAMPNTYSGYMEKMSGTVMHGEKEGEYSIEPPDISGLQAWVSSMKETQTERLGGAFAGAGGKILKNIVPKSWGKLSTKGAIGALVKAGGTANKHLAQAGVNGLIGETGEEVAGAVFDRAIRASSDEEWKAFWSKDNMLQMVGGFAPMSILGLGMNGATAANKRVSALRSKRRFVNFTRDIGSKNGVDMAEEIISTPIEDLGKKMHKYTQEIGGYTNGELNDNGIEFNRLAAEVLRSSTERDIANEWDSYIQEQEAEDNVNTGYKRTVDDTVDDRVDDTEQTIPQVQQGDEVEYDNARWIVGDVAEEDGEYTFGDESIPLKKGNVLMFEADGNGIRILESTADLYAEDKDNGIESRRQEIYEKYRPVMNVDTGNIIQLSSTADNDNIAYVVKGRVVYDEEGNIDYDKSDDTIYYKVYDKEGNEVDGGTPRPLHLKTHRTEFGKVLSDTPIEEYVDNELYPQKQNNIQQAINNGQTNVEQSTPEESVSTDERQEVTHLQNTVLDSEEADLLMSAMEQNAEAMPVIELTPDNWVAEFGQNGTVSTPIGDVKMGDNQLAKLFLKKRTREFGMIKPTLVNPDVIIEKTAVADNAERNTKLLFVKTFKDENGQKHVHFENVTVQKGGLEVSISSHIVDKSAIRKELANGIVIYNKPELTSIGSDVYLTETHEGQSDLVPTQKANSDLQYKGTTNKPDIQEEFYNSLPKNKKGEIDENLMSAEQKIRYAQIEFGEDLDLVKDYITEQSKALSEKIAKLTNKTGKSVAEYKELAALKADKNVFVDYLHSLRDMQEDSMPRQTVEEAAAKREESRREEQAQREQMVREKEEREGVPDFLQDTPEDARLRGFRLRTGERIDRQEPIEVSRYNTARRKFTNDTGAVEEGRPMVKRTIIDNAQTKLQPSHRGGRANIYHFITEAQPKERTDKASRVSAAQIAANINPEEITGGITAYNGSPIANNRLEVIQGNNRAEALRLMYEEYPQSAETYKQYLIDNAENYGMSADEVRTMKEPIAVDIYEGTDGNAILLGQYTQQDVESGGVHRINPSGVVKHLKSHNMLDRFITTLLNGVDEENSVSDVISSNLRGVLPILDKTGAISMTQRQGFFDERGDVTSGAIDDFKGILTSLITEGGYANINSDFLNLPDSAKTALYLQTYRAVLNKQDGPTILNDIQNSILLYTLVFGNNNKGKVGVDESRREVMSWLMTAQPDFNTLNEDGTYPLVDMRKKFSNFAAELTILYKSTNLRSSKDKGRGLYNIWDDFYNLLEGKGDLFTAGEKKSLQESINENFNIDYVPIRQNERNTLGSRGEASRAGRRGSESELSVGEQSEAGTAAADDRGRTEADIAEAVKDIDVEPTEAQKKAGNYKKGHVKIQGFDITIENPKGAIRKGVDDNGKAWSTEMKNHYGYFKNTEGKDGDHIDVFIGDNPNSKRIFVVDQVNPKTKEFDESKVMLGFDTEDEAKKAYLSNYSKDWKGFKDITYVDIDTFKEWLYDGAKQRKPFGEYSNIRFRSIKDINDRFNEELQQQIDGTLPKGHVYSLGMPNDILRSAGLPNLPIEMSAERLAGKSQQANHPFELSETESLPAAIQHPIAIFDSTKKDGSSVILTELKHGDSNFVAVLGVRRSDKQRKIDVEVNSIRSLYPKTHIRGIIDWFNSKDNLLRWVDKEKALNFISTQEPNYLAGGDNAQSTSSESNLSSSKPAEVRNIFKRVAKVIKDFENPTLSEEKNEETRLKASKRKARGATTEKLEELVTLLKKTGFADVKTGEDFYNALAEIEGSERYSSQSEKKLYNPRRFITPVRGEWTKEKIKKRLKESGGSLVGYDRAAKLISEFDSPDELAENIFYHGTVYGSGHLKPSILMSDMDVERYGGGGYGDKYWGISVSRSKKIASNFSGTSKSVSILPIVLAKGAKVKEMPNIEDSADIDDVIVDLWKEGVDAVWVGDKNKGEQELCVINPRAIVNINSADTYRVYGLGGEENPISIINKEGIKKLYEDAKQYREQKKIAPKGPLKPFRFYFDENNHIGDKKPDDVYDREMKEYEEQLRVYESSDEYKKWQRAQEYAQDNIRFMIGKQATEADDRAIAEETADIKAKAISDGTFMKAPNGKDTNLTEQQWLQVRTKAFKKWFGDWEKAYKLELIENLQPIEVDNIGLSRDRAEEEYKKIGTSKTNRYDNRRIEFVNNAFGKIARHKNSALILDIIPQLNDLFESAIPIYFEEEREPLKSTNIVGSHNYLGKVRVNDEDYYVRITAQELTPSWKQNEKQGKSNFHNMAVSDIAIYDESGSSVTVKDYSIDNDNRNRFVDAKLQHFFETAREARENSSKVVDGNGEPLVVYHGTDNAGFTEFEEQGEGLYFSNIDRASWYVKSEDRPTLARNFGEGIDYYGGIYACFLNIRKPKRKNARGKYAINFDQLSRGKNNDGVIVENIKDPTYDSGSDFESTNYIVFNPTQIKSATDNIGTFDGEDGDIRYRRPNGTVLGFVKGNTIYLNPDEVSLNTPIHEFGHLWVSQVKEHFPDLWAKGKELFLESDYLRKVQADPNYRHLDLDGQIDEAMARAIGDRGEQELDKTLLEKILDWIAEVWEKIGGVFGIDNLTSEQISNLTLQNFTDMATSELLSGQNLTERVNGNSGGATRYNTADETADIKAKAILDGTFMKAPNGKDTNLTERQWLQVRTKAFKKWFGDWEKTARIEKLKKTKPIEITGEEVKPSDDLKEYKKNALEYGKTLQGEYTNKDTGITIQLQRGRKNGGLNEVLQHDYKDREHLQSIAAIPQIIENATYIDSEPNNDIPKNPDVKEYQYYVCGLKIGGEDYTVRAVVAVDNKGDRYYDHKLTNIEKGKLLDQINSQAIKNNGFGTTPGTKPTTVVSEYKDSKLISLLQENSSKVVDENGEPMVVYHGTNKFGFTVFDKEFSDDKTSIFFADRVDIAKGYAGVNADVRSLYDDDTTGGYSKDEILSMLFADVDISSHTNGWDVANDILPYITEDIGITAEYDDEDGVLTLSSDYTGDTYRLTDEEFSWEKVENWLRDNADLENVIDKDAGIYGVFVNARNVLDIDAGGSMWSSIPKKKVKGAEGVGNMDTRDIVEHAKKLNYDGVYIKDLLDTGGRGYGLVGDIEGDIFISLVDKNQIKSATDNIGTFDGEDEDIRYSVGGADYFVNERFNEQLEKLTEKNADSTMFRLGYPDMILQSTGIPNKELRLYGNKLLKKAEKHDFNVKDLVDLPTSIQTPMFVFKGNHPDSFSIVTELKIRDKNVLVSIERNKDGEVDFNLISSVYGKSGRGIVHWLNNGKALYVNKEKALDYLRISAPIAEAQDKGELNPSVSTEKALAWQAALAPIASATLKQELITATKIIENFENPPINEKKVIDGTTNDMVRYSIQANDQLDREDEIMGKKAAEIYEARVKMGKQMNQSDPKKMPNKKIFDEINRKTENIRAKTAEHAADCYLPMKHFIETLNKHGYNIADYNNWYMNVFSLASKNEAEYEKYQAERSVPLQRAAKAAMDSGQISYRELENYLILKHGQERNKYYKERDEKLGVKPMKDYSGTEAVMFEEFCKRTGIKVKTIEEDIPTLVDGDPNMIRYDNGKSEFSKDGKKIPDFEVNKRFELWRNQHTPEEIIKDYEEKIGKEKVEDLWGKIRKATQFTLDSQKEGGLTSEDMYKKASGMWEYFVPLRGFDMGTAQDEYDYDLNGITLFTDFRVEQTLGRTRRSVSPLAWTEQMAHITIQQKNKNLLNQSLRRLASVSTARKDNIMFLSKQYKAPDVIENGKVVREGALINPPAHTGNPTEDRAAFERWETSMKEGVKNGTVEVVEHSNVNFGMIVSADKVKQHVVRVYEGGRPVDIIFNTSPSVPRAINGLNHKAAISNHWIYKNLQAGTRLMAQTMTTLNPAFVGKNFTRDYLFANTMLLGREDMSYAANFNKNIVKARSVMFDYVRGKSLLGWAAGDKGSVRDNEYGRLLTEFVMNGGKTGFSQMLKFEKMSSDFKKQTEKGDKKVHYVVNDYIHFIEAANDYAENITRFAAYCTSRQAGRSIERSISDAKELTINFNRKGTDGGIWGTVRSLCAFSNASIQALVVFSRGVKANPKRMSAFISGYTAMAITMAVIARLIGGDDDDYFKLSKYDRQNNLCLPMFGGGFVKIPLPQEMRVFYKLGDEIALCVWNNEPPEVAAQEVFMGALDLLPSFAAGATSISDVLDEKIGAGDLLLAHNPITILQPITQIMANRNFLNYRIYDDNKWGGRRKELPEYRKALRNKGGETYSPNFVVKLSEGISRLTGGSDLKRGVVEVNPDVINHLMRGYFGGLYSSAVAAINMGDKGAQSIAAGEIKMKTTDSPTMKAFYVSPSNLRYTDDILNARYMDVLKEAKKHANVYANYLKEGEVDRFEKETKMTEDEALDWRYLVKTIDKEVQELRNEIATAETTKERDEALRQLEALQREAIDMAVKLKK